MLLSDAVRSAPCRSYMHILGIRFEGPEAAAEAKSKGEGAPPSGPAVDVSSLLGPGLALDVGAIMLAQQEELEEQQREVQAAAGLPGGGGGGGARGRGPKPVTEEVGGWVGGRVGGQVGERVAGSPYGTGLVL